MLVYGAWRRLPIERKLQSDAIAKESDEALMSVGCIC